MKRWLYLLPLLALVMGSARAVAQLPAFPGAQGAGAASVGGRGGTIMEITNLNDSGPGSLRACVEASFPRTCMCRISGSITNASRLQVSSPFITIPGQTCPGGPLTLHSASAAQCNGGSGGDCGTLFISTHDVIIRYVTYDGNANTPTGPDTGTVGFEMASGNVYNVYIDHTTSRKWGNKTYVTTSNGPVATATVHDITVAWSLMYEPNNLHPVIIALDATSGSAMASVNQDFHHNFGANFNHRWGLFNVRSVRWVNNLAYNSLANSDDFNELSWGGFRGDFIGNKYVDGPQSVIKVHDFLANSDQGGTDASNNCVNGNPCDNPGPPSLYYLNNIGHPGNNTGAVPIPATHVVNDAGQISLTYQGWEGGEAPKDGITIAPMPASWYRATPLPAETFPIVADPVENLDAVLLATVGNSQRLACDGTWLPNRDSEDTRVIKQYQNRGSGGPFNGPNYNGISGNPAIDPGTPCVEDIDHIYIGYKQRVGLPVGQNAGSAAFENFLNGAASGTSTPPLTPPVTPPANPPPQNAFPAGASVTTTAKVNVWKSVDPNSGASTLVATEPSGTAGIVGTAAPVVRTDGTGTFYSICFGATCGYVGSGQFVLATALPPPAIKGVTLSCDPATIAASASSTCNVVVTGTGNLAVTWKAQGGSLSACSTASNTCMVFTPGTQATSGTVTATSVQDTTQSGNVTISVTQTPPPVCPALPVKVQVTIGGLAVGSMTCTPNAANTGYICTIP